MEKFAGTNQQIPESMKTISVQDAIQAQRALRALAGLGPEMFPIEAFVGMISDEIEHLRRLGHSDEEIADAITKNSTIEITAAEIGEHYASMKERHGISD